MHSKSTTLLRGLTASLAAAALVTFGYAAIAQDKAPKKAATASACKGLDEASCKAKEAACNWVGEITTKAGQKRKAHCRSKPKKKKDAAKK